MKLPVNFLLYLTTIGLLALAAKTFQQAIDVGSLETKTRSYKEGQQEAADRMAEGRGAGPAVGAWTYNSTSWHQTWMDPNVIGKDPPPPPEQATEQEPVEPVVEIDRTPLEDIIELVTIMYDPDGAQSHVTVRYKENVEVQPPEWYLRENEPVTATGAPGYRPGDAAAAARGNVRRGGRPRAGRPAAPRPTSTPPSSAGRTVLQRLWVEGSDEPRFEARLWPPHDHIKLVRVAGSGLSAFFVRQPPAAPSQEPVATEEEELIKSSLPISQELLRLLRDLDPAGPAAVTSPAAPTAADEQWQPVDETTRIDGVWHVGRRDQQTFADDGNELLSQINVDSYVSRTGSGQRGLQVMNVSTEIQQRFGVQQGELILAVNGTPVTTKAQAVNTGKKMYNRGVRRFVVTFLSNGREIERTYQAPDK
jgi:hypothetical protein